MESIPDHSLDKPVLKIASPVFQSSPVQSSLYTSPVVSHLYLLCVCVCVCSTLYSACISQLRKCTYACATVDKIIQYTYSVPHEESRKLIFEVFVNLVCHGTC